MMARPLKLYPGAAANDSSHNRRWISQENQDHRRGQDAAGPVRPTLVSPVAVWEDDGGNASFPTGSARTVRQAR